MSCFFFFFFKEKSLLICYEPALSLSVKFIAVNLYNPQIAFRFTYFTKFCNMGLMTVEVCVVKHFRPHMHADTTVEETCQKSGVMW